MRPLFVALIVLILLCSAAFGQPGSWVELTGTGTSIQLTDVQFSSRLAGWVSGHDGTILRTTNGGTTWSSQYSEYTLLLRDLYVLDSLHAWAIGRNNLAGYQPRVFYTINGGENWYGRMSGAEYGVHFVSPTTGWAVGNGGAVRISTDGGNTWAAQISNTTRRLYTVFFRDTSMGWCAGDSGTIIRTTDAGLHWTVCPTPAIVRLQKIHFVSPTAGWAVGDQGTIMHSTDGGLTWASQTSGASARLNAIHCLDATTAYVGGEDGLILKTEDGGATWRGQHTGTVESLYGLCFVDPSRGWAVGANGFACATTVGGGTASLLAPVLDSPDDMAVLTDTNPLFRWRAAAGAASYALVAALNRDMTTSPQRADGLTDTTGHLSGLLGDTTYYWRAGARFGEGPRMWSASRIVRTGVSLPLAPVLVWPEKYAKPVSTSTRLSWKQTRMATRYHLQVDDSPGFLYPEVDRNDITDTAFTLSGLSNNTIYFWRVAAANSAGEGPFSSFWSFTTEGLAWKRVAQDILTRPVSAWFFDRTSGLVSGESTSPSGRVPALWRTTDAGESWRTIMLPDLSSSHRAFSLQFVDTMQGFFVSEYGGIFKTTDGGETWARKSADIWWGENQLLFVSRLAGWALVGTRSIVRTTDGGETWNEVYTAPDYVWGFHFADSLHGWIAGGEVVHRTSNGGLAWSIDSTHVPERMTTVHGVTSQMVYAGGVKNSFMKSTDGGMSWSYRELTSGSALYLLKFCVLDSLTVHVGGNNGIIYCSTDGGTTWTQSDEVGTHDYTTLMMVDREAGWAVLEYVALMRTMTGGMPTAVKQESHPSSAPRMFELAQNFPNPFNPSTTIRYALPHRSHMTLTVFNTLGQWVATLVDGTVEAGYHEVAFDAAGLASGVYFYRLQAPGYVQTHKLLLLR